MWGCYGRQKLKDCIEMREKPRWKVGEKAFERQVESTVAVATSPINGKREAHVAKVRLCRQRGNAQKNWRRLTKWGLPNCGKCKRQRGKWHFPEWRGIFAAPGREALEPRFVVWIWEWRGRRGRSRGRTQQPVKQPCSSIIQHQREPATHLRRS